MKLVREHINEKFSEVGDPVHDMGIGMEAEVQKFIEFANNKRRIDLGIKDNVDNLLIWAAYFNRFDIVDYALYKGADINIYGGQAITFAASAGNIKMGVYLIKKGLDIQLIKRSSLNYSRETRENLSDIEFAVKNEL